MVIDSLFLRATSSVSLFLSKTKGTGGTKEKEEVKCARKTRAEERRKPMGREVAGARSRKLAAMSTPVSLPLPFSPFALFLSLPLRLPLPPVNATACMHRATMRYRPLHFSSSRASGRRRKERKENRREVQRKKKEEERERERERSGRSCARGKIKSLSDAPVVMSRTRATTRCSPRITRSRLRTATFVAAARHGTAGVKRDRTDLI